MTNTYTDALADEVLRGLKIAGLGSEAIGAVLDTASRRLAATFDQPTQSTEVPQHGGPQEHVFHGVIRDKEGDTWKLEPEGDYRLVTIGGTPVGRGSLVRSREFIEDYYGIVEETN